MSLAATSTHGSPPRSSNSADARNPENAPLLVRNFISTPRTRVSVISRSMKSSRSAGVAQKSSSVEVRPTTSSRLKPLISRNSRSRRHNVRRRARRATSVADSIGMRSRTVLRWCATRSPDACESATRRKSRRSRAAAFPDPETRSAWNLSSNTPARAETPPLKPALPRATGPAHLLLPGARRSRARGNHSRGDSRRRSTGEDRDPTERAKLHRSRSAAKRIDFDLEAPGMARRHLHSETDVPSFLSECARVTRHSPSLRTKYAQPEKFSVGATSVSAVMRSL